MEKIIYCAKKDCESNVKDCCDAELISINGEGLCDSFEKEELPDVDNSDRERDIDERN